MFCAFWRNRSVVEVSELAVVRKLHELMVWFAGVVGRMPRVHRYSLGQRTEEALEATLERLLRAQYSKRKLPHLDEASLQMDLARMRVRRMHELQFITHEQYGQFCDRFNEVGKQVGGWRRMVSGKGS